MSENPAGEFQIPNGIHHPDAQRPVSDEVQDIYADIYETSEIAASKERAFHQDIEHLYGIGDSISAARENKLKNQYVYYEEHASGFISALAKKIFYPDFFERQKQEKAVSVNDLMRSESQIGSEIFGTRPDGEHIQFFNEDRNHWYLYTEKEQRSGPASADTIHYEIQPSGILKICDKTGIKGVYIDGEEYKNFLLVVNVYHDQVMKRIYRQNLSSYSKTASKPL